MVMLFGQKNQKAIHDPFIDKKAGICFATLLKSDIMTRNGWSKNEFNDKISFDNLLSFHEEEEKGWIIFGFYLSYIINPTSGIQGVAPTGLGYSALYDELKGWRSY